MDKLDKFLSRGYFIKSMEPSYHSMNLERTMNWFKDILGWYGEIYGGTYGMITDIPIEIIDTGTTSFRCIHMYHGEPEKTVVATIQTKNLPELYQYVKQNGWDDITDIDESFSDFNSCYVTTIDGCVLMFVEDK